MTGVVHAVAESGYRAGAAAYERGRPSFPDEAVDWLLGHLALPAGEPLLEIGSGTGKLTRQLVARGLCVLAVEPVDAMRARLAALGSDVTPLAATAEQLPFATGSLAGALFAQSLHWCDVSRALAEVQRVLAAGARIGLIWNMRDVSVPWQRDLDALLASVRGDAPHSGDGRWQAAVAASPDLAVEATGSWRWQHATSVGGVLERVRSVSYVASLGGPRQAAVLARVREILAARRGVEDDADPVPFPYVTETAVLADIRI
jgi:SAM-dependent methyltransferase